MPRNGHETEEEACGLCDGFGTITCPECNDVREYRNSCTECRGSGEIPCPECS